MGKNKLRGCILCQKSKISNQKQEGMIKNIIPDKPLDLIAVDLFGELPVGRGGVKYIFVVLDVFSKFIKLYPVKRAISKVLAEKITRCYMVEVVKPNVILSDHGSQLLLFFSAYTLPQQGIFD